MRRPSSPQQLYTFWHNALRGQFGSINPDWPHCGYYRMRKMKNGPWLPVAIWVHQEKDDDGNLTSQEELRCLVNGEVTDALEVWVGCCRHPVTEKNYHKAVETGQWPDSLKPAVEIDSYAPVQVTDVEDAAPIF